MKHKKKFKTDRDGRVCCSLKLFWKTISRARKTWGYLTNDANKEIEQTCTDHVKLVRRQDKLKISGKDRQLYLTYCMINKLTKIQRWVSLFLLKNCSGF